MAQIKQYGRVNLSSTDSKKHIAGIASAEPLSLLELTEILVKHYDFHEGIFNLLVEFQVGVGSVGPDPLKPAPGAAIGVTRIGLAPAPVPPNSTSVDASILNPGASSVKKRTGIKKTIKKTAKK